MSKKRNDIIFELRSSGKTLNEIGLQFGITRQRVEQILKNKHSPKKEEPRFLMAFRGRLVEVNPRNGKFIGYVLGI